jgi:hypothetical protein
MAFNFGGAASGAMSGASIGSAIPGIGTGIGAAVGGIAGLFGKKKKKKPKMVSTLDAQQQGLYNDYVGSLRGQGPFSDMYNYDADQANQVFDANTARPAYRGFQENVIPQITGQFRGNNLMNSSYTGEALGRAGRNVQENLDALRSQQNFQGQQQSQANKQNAMQNILGMSTFGYEGQAPKSNAIDQILGATGPAAGQWFSNYLNSSRAGTSTPGISGGSGRQF